MQVIHNTDKLTKTVTNDDELWSNLALMHACCTALIFKKEKKKKKSAQYLRAAEISWAGWLHETLSVSWGKAMLGSLDIYALQ